MRASTKWCKQASATATPMYPLLNSVDPCGVLTVTPRHIQHLVAERRIRFLKVGRFVRFDPAELNVWLKSDGSRFDRHGVAPITPDNVVIIRPGRLESIKSFEHSAGVTSPSSCILRIRSNGYVNRNASCAFGVSIR